MHIYDRSDARQLAAQSLEKREEGRRFLSEVPGPLSVNCRKHWCIAGASMGEIQHERISNMTGDHDVLVRPR